MIGSNNVVIDLRLVQESEQKGYNTWSKASNDPERHSFIEVSLPGKQVNFHAPLAILRHLAEGMLGEVDQLEAKWDLDS